MSYIGKTATIIGYSEEGWVNGSFVAHICLEIEGKRVFFQSTDPTDVWEIKEEEA